jgi:hypothetical protein
MSATALQGSISGFLLRAFFQQGGSAAHMPPIRAMPAGNQIAPDEIIQPAMKPLRRVDEAAVKQMPTIKRSQQQE